MARKKEDRLTVMPLNVSDFLGSDRVSEMSGMARGIYLLMLVHQWNAGGKGLPPGVPSLAIKLAVKRDVMKRVWGSLKSCFVERGGRLFNERLHEEWLQAQERKRIATESGRVGGRKSAERVQGSLEGSLGFETKGASSSPSPTPSSPKKKKKPLAPLPRGTIPLSLRSHEEKYSELAAANDWFGFPGWNARTVKRAETLPEGFWDQVAAQAAGINEDRVQRKERAGWPWLTLPRVIERIMGGEFGRGKRTSFTDEELREMDRKRGFDV